MKRISIIAATLLAAVSCQQILIEDKADGAISVSLENSPVVELVTKADAADQSEGTSSSTDESTAPSVDVDDFNVYIESDALGFEPMTLKYGAMKSPMAARVGNYTIYADNVSENTSLTGYGEVRYACDPVMKPVEAGKAAAFKLECSMVNTAVSVEFMGSFSQFIDDGYLVEVWTEDASSRVLKYNATNTAGENPVVGYFTPSAYLVYKFTGNDKDGNALAPISGRIQIRAATHLTLQFKIKGDESGNINKPTVTVDTTCEELEPVSVEVDPTKKNNSNQ